MLNRREVLKAGLAVPLVGTSALIEPAVAMPDGRFEPASEAAGPAWPKTLGRIGQLNMTEHDPVSLDIEAWADYWAGLKVGATYISVTGILAYYQTKVPFHRKGKFLGDRDFFGECNQAARKRGMRTIARMSPDLNWEDATRAHPDWFERDQEGKLHGSKEAPGLYRTCMFSDYMTDYIPAIINEVTSQYEVDAVYCNGWPPLGSLPECYCAICRKLPPPGTPAYWDKFNERMVYLWNYYDSLIQKTGREKFFFPNMGGGVRASMNLDAVGKIAQWFQGDNQGRGGEDAPIWGCALQGRVAQAVMDGKMAANITGAWSTGPIRWRNAGKSPAEAEMWFSETSASGLVPYYHIVGAETGMGVDRRELDTPREYFGWTAKNDAHFRNKSTIARVGVVMGQRTHLFHKAQPNASMQQFVNGMYYALLEGRFLFDFVHEDRMDAAHLSKYSALILPNVAMLSDAQCAQLKAFVDRGGSLLATFETSLYDEYNSPRANFGLADVFGIEKAGEVIGTNGNAYYARIERDHEIVSGFKNTGWLPGAEYRVPLKPVENPVLTVVPGFTAYPPELAYPPTPQTNVPAAVLRERGQSRVAYIAGDVERSLWVSGDIDLSQLLRNTIDWITRDERPVRIEGPGLVEVFAYETEPGFALHVLNYTNPNAHRGLMREFNPIGVQRVSFAVPEGKNVSRVQLLRSGEEAAFERVSGRIEFTIPLVRAYEVAAIHA
ncbi:MAG TPA: alpha-amylase family protein [Terracidiphilus sp.]|nr:alpha-amylase family protein [Terracidiphilus sp.]